VSAAKQRPGVSGVYVEGDQLMLITAGTNDIPRAGRALGTFEEVVGDNYVARSLHTNAIAEAETFGGVIDFLLEQDETEAEDGGNGGTK